MIIVERAKEREIQEISAFICSLNNEKEHHVGFCGKDVDEIVHSMKEDFTDFSAHEAFIVAREDNTFIGVLGFDTDLSRGSAEVWGPFICHMKWIEIAEDMWTKGVELLPDSINAFQLFYDIKNTNGLQFAANLGFLQTSEHAILSIDKKRMQDIAFMERNELSKEYYLDMQILHDRLFPNSYYSGKEIIHRISKHRKVFIVQDYSVLLGYVYTETEPDLGEASIEFVGVKETARGKGIGSSLLNTALQWVFSFETVKDSSICVNKNNIKAISLYKKVGFEEVHHLVAFCGRRRVDQ